MSDVSEAAIQAAAEAMTANAFGSDWRERAKLACPPLYLSAARAAVAAVAPLIRAQALEEAALAIEDGCRLYAFFDSPVSAARIVRGLVEQNPSTKENP